MTRDIREFFEQYRDAFDRLDGEAVAALYDIPSGIVSDRGFTQWNAYDPIRQNMVALCELYRNHGYRAATFETGAFISQGPDHAVADISWRIDRINGQEPWCFRTTYNLHRTAKGWRVLLCTAYEEKRLNA